MARGKAEFLGGTKGDGTGGGGKKATVIPYNAKYLSG
jgi:hypothetical protein